MFLASLAKIRWFSDHSEILAKSRLTSIELVCAYEFKEHFKKTFNPTSYCLYLVFNSRSIEIDRDQFSSKNTEAWFSKK